MDADQVLGPGVWDLLDARTEDLCEHIDNFNPEYNDAIVNEIENSVRKVFISEVCLEDW